MAGALSNVYNQRSL